VTSADSSLF